MESHGNSSTPDHWHFKGREDLIDGSSITVRGALNALMQNIDPTRTTSLIDLAQGDPSCFPSFRTTSVADDAVCATLCSAQFNRYPSTGGIPSARRAVAEYLTKDLPYKLSPNDVFITAGCVQALITAITVLARPNANILLPRPGFPYYEARARFSHVKIRHFDLIPEKNWEVDLDAVEALADADTVAMVIINPGNPCGNVFNYEHLKKIAETARKVGILVISDEVYHHLTLGNVPFVPMGVFASIAPVITLGSISKRWMVPGWRLGWIVTNDPNGIMRKQGVVDSIPSFLNITSSPATFLQAALPQIIENTPHDFFEKNKNTLEECAEICYSWCKKIPYITCPSKPKGCMFVMVKIGLSLLDDIKDDLDFCNKLVKEESVMVLPGITVGYKNWLRVTFAVETSSLDDGFRRIKAFCERHAKKK